MAKWYLVMEGHPLFAPKELPLALSCLLFLTFMPPRYCSQQSCVISEHKVAILGFRPSLYFIKTRFFQSQYFITHLIKQLTVPLSLFIPKYQLIAQSKSPLPSRVSVTVGLSCHSVDSAADSLRVHCGCQLEGRFASPTSVIKIS